jgi:hypothetical protein
MASLASTLTVFAVATAVIVGVTPGAFIEGPPS